MKPTDMLQITDKGGDEVARRTYRLGIRLRSVLLLLSKLQPVGFMLQKTAFPPDQLLAAIETLTNDGFIILDELALPESVGTSEPSTRHPVESRSSSALTGQPSSTTPPAGPVPDEWLLDPAAVLSETKFLLVDFCVDCFSMQSERLTEDIRACQSIGDLGKLFPELIAMTRTQEPGHLTELGDVISKANATARLKARTASGSSALN